MKGFFSKLKKNKKGYTLTELIVVVAILGVLALIAAPMVLDQIQNSKEKADMASAKAIETAVQLCLADGTLYIKAATGTDPEMIDVKNGTIDFKVRQKLAGKEYPINNLDNTHTWYLDKETGKVYNNGTSVTGTAEPIDNTATS